jgi:hypothetical protein
MPVNSVTNQFPSVGAGSYQSGASNAGGAQAAAFNQAAAASGPPAGNQGGQANLIKELVSLLQQLLTQLTGSAASGSQVVAGGARGTTQPGGPAVAPVQKPATPSTADGGSPSAPAAPSAKTPGAPDAPTGSPAPSSTSAGTGPNAMEITNTQDHAITVGKFKNGESATAPSAVITLQPGQTGTLHYENGEAGFAAQADATGKFQPSASRLEYEADKDGKMKYPDVSYIDGRNASISLSDGAGLNKGDSKSIAGGADPSLVTTDSGGNKTVAGWYDGSNAQMQAGGAYMAGQLGTTGAYLHPNDDTLAQGQNPMSATQSNTIKASFGNA